MLLQIKELYKEKKIESIELIGLLMRCQTIQMIITGSKMKGII